MSTWIECFDQRHCNDLQIVKQTLYDNSERRCDYNAYYFNAYHVMFFLFIQ